MGPPPSCVALPAASPPILIGGGGRRVLSIAAREADIVSGQALLVGEDAQIEDDLIAAGYSQETERGSTVGGELLYGGYQALVAGNMEENISGGVTAFELGGEVAGNVNVEVDRGGAQPAGGQFAPGPPSYTFLHRLWSSGERESGGFP